MTKKIPCIPLLFHDSKFITDFRENLNFSTLFFFRSSVLYLIMAVSFLLTLSIIPRKISHSVFNSKGIGNIIRGLDPNKARRHDMIRICMLKMCGESIHKPLGYVFPASLNGECFPSEWRKASVVPIHKKMINKF